MTASGSALRGPSWGGVWLGALLWLLAYPPFVLVAPSFLALAPFVAFLEGTSSRDSFGRIARGGAAYGFVASLVLFHWVPVALWRFTPWAVMYATVLVGMVAAGWVGVALLTVLLWRRVPRLPRWLAFGLCWTAWEAVQAHLGPLSFPWLGLGASLAGVPILIQPADVVGVPGLTLWLASINAAVGGAWARRKGWGRVASTTAITLVIAWGYGVLRVASIPIRASGRVLLVQPNVPASISWYAAGDSLVAALDLQTREAAAGGLVDLIVWPEVAVPGALAEHEAWRRRIESLVEATGTPLVFGALDRTVAQGTFNAAVVWRPGVTDAGLEVYHKRRLVPVTERPILGLGVSTAGRAEASGFLAGGEPGTMASPVGPFGLTICFESIFPGLVRRYRRAGAAVLINLTNDVWMGPTAGPWQHAAHLRLRAVETRMAMVQASNSGVSQVLDPLGRVVGEAPAGVTTTLAADVYTTTSVAPAARYGDWIGPSIVVAVALVGVLALAGRRTQPVSPPR